MQIKVTNCLDCPFKKEDYDFNMVDKEICIGCGYLKNMKEYI